MTKGFHSHQEQVDGEVNHHRDDHKLLQEVGAGTAHWTSAEPDTHPLHTCACTRGERQHTLAEFLRRR